MSDHILGNENLIKNLAIVDHKGKTNEFGNYRASSRPCFYRLTRADCNSLVDLGKKLFINIRPFFKRSSHSNSLNLKTLITNHIITPQTENVRFFVFE